VVGAGSGEGSYRLRPGNAERPRRHTYGRTGAFGQAADAGIGGGKKSLQDVGGLPQQRREVMRQLAEHYPVQVIYRVWETSRSTYYSQSQAFDESDLRVSFAGPCTASVLQPPGTSSDDRAPRADTGTGECPSASSSGSSDNAAARIDILIFPPCCYVLAAL
jgi:hypothetical protein